MDNVVFWQRKDRYEYGLIQITSLIIFLIEIYFINNNLALEILLKDLSLNNNGETQRK